MAGLNKYQAYPEYRDSGMEWLGRYLALGRRTQENDYLVVLELRLFLMMNNLLPVKSMALFLKL